MKSVPLVYANHSLWAPCHIPGVMKTCSINFTLPSWKQKQANKQNQNQTNTTNMMCAHSFTNTRCSQMWMPSWTFPGHRIKRPECRVIKWLRSSKISAQCLRLVNLTAGASPLEFCPTHRGCAEEWRLSEQMCDSQCRETGHPSNSLICRRGGEGPRQGWNEVLLQSCA